MTHAPLKPQAAADRFIELIVALLAPMFVSVAKGDVTIARAIAIEAIDAYPVQTNADLLCAAQLIGFGIAALASLSQSMAEPVSASMALRLRANAVAATRAGETCRRALAQQPDVAARTEAVATSVAQPRKQAAAPAPPEPAPSESASEAQHRKMWAGAMADVAAEVTADLINLPPSQRRAASMRADALSSVARDLLAGNEGQFPPAFPPRPASQPG